MRPAAEGRLPQAPGVCSSGASCQPWGPYQNESLPPWECDYQSNSFCGRLYVRNPKTIMRKFKTALFGTGFVGRVHLEGIRRLGYVQLYAIGEPQIEKANQLAAEFGAEKTEADYRRILEDPAVEAVHVCTPNALHFPIARDAMQAGKHVICEKPLATS